jgi:hypothetical protein
LALAHCGNHDEIECTCVGCMFRGRDRSIAVGGAMRRAMIVLRIMRRRAWGCAPPYPCDMFVVVRRMMGAASSGGRRLCLGSVRRDGGQQRARRFDSMFVRPVQPLFGRRAAAARPAGGGAFAAARAVHARKRLAAVFALKRRQRHADGGDEVRRKRPSDDRESTGGQASQAEPGRKAHRLKPRVRVRAPRRWLARAPIRTVLRLAPQVTILGSRLGHVK